MKTNFHGRIKPMEEGRETTKEKNLEGEAPIALQPATEMLPSTEFVKVEKNLASLGFFTPSSKRLRNAQEKTFTITTLDNGRRIELKGTIIPSAKYGLPITADQDKWIALCEILTDIMRKEGKVTNPISFSSADILRLLHKYRHSGKNYREIEEWLDVLFSTTIFSEGVVYLANEKRRVKDRFRVFERAVSFGKELPDGKVADKNYVWFSDWQLQNINSNHLLPIDFGAYRELKNHIAKALVPLLQVWLYATRDEGVYEKRYDDLCQMLNIRQYQYASLITRTLSPSLDELKQFGYLADWRIEETSSGDGYKIIFYHGEKFHRDRRARLKRSQAADTSVREETVGAKPKVIAQSGPAKQTPEPPRAVSAKVNDEFLAELIKRGVAEPYARKILAEIQPGQPVVAQLEWGDLQVRQSAGKILNPAGFYVSLVSGNVTPPANFETAAKRKEREDRQRHEEDERRSQEDLETEYYWYCEREIDRYIASLDPAEVAGVREERRRACREKTPNLSVEITDSFAEREARQELGKRTPVMSIEEFKATLYRHIVNSMQPVDDLPPGAMVPEEPPIAEFVVEATASEGVAEPTTETPEAAPPMVAETQVPEAEASMPEPIILLASQPPRPQDGGSIEPQIA